MLRSIQFSQRLLQGRRIGCNLRMFDAIARSRKASVGLFHAMFNRRELPRFQVGELLFCA